MANWYEMLKKAMADDDFDNKICTLTDEQLKREFNNDWRCSEGTPFTAWSVRYVYFPWFMRILNGYAERPAIHVMRH